MLEDSDIGRLLTELMPQLEGNDPIAAWLEREQISPAVWEKIGKDIASIVVSDVADHLDDPVSSVEALMSGIQLAFFVGWVASREYAQPRDMSQTKEE